MIIYNSSLVRLWPNGKIPYTFFWTIRTVNYREDTFSLNQFKTLFTVLRVQFIKEAIQDIEEDSCLEFEDITDVMEDYMKDIKTDSSKDFCVRDGKFHCAPDDYPDYLK